MHTCTFTIHQSIHYNYVDLHIDRTMTDHFISHDHAQTANIVVLVMLTLNLQHILFGSHGAHA